MLKKKAWKMELRRIGEVIGELRRDRKLTQAQLAEAAGIAKSTLANIELGRLNFEITSFLNVLEALDEPMVYVLYRAVVEPKLELVKEKDGDKLTKDLVKIFIRDIFRHVR